MMNEIIPDKSNIIPDDLGRKVSPSINKDKDDIYIIEPLISNFSPLASTHSVFNLNDISKIVTMPKRKLK